MTRRKARPRNRRKRPQAATGRLQTIQQFRKASNLERQRWTLAVHTVTKMRGDGVSLSKAARVLGTDIKTVSRLAGSALRKDKRGRWTATKRDRLLRVLDIPSAKGTRTIAVRDSRAASTIAAYADAIRKYIRTGDASVMKPFRRLTVRDATGKRIALLTNLRTLDRLGHAGMLSFESLYARTA